MRFIQQGLALLLSGCLLFIGVREGLAYQTDASNSQPPPQAAHQSPEQLQQLAAPIALYPDTLVAQIMAAATYPDQIIEAEKWIGQHKDLTGDTLAKEVDKQSWDPGVKALTQFPSVLANMSRNLAWTSELGEAYVNQQQDLTTAIQALRQRAKQAGNLNATTQETVSTKGQTIVIQPAAPDVVYVPQYDPWLVYGAPMAVFPGWYPFPGLFLDGPGIAFGLGFGFPLYTGFGWGWHSWGFDWHHGGGRVVYNHNTYISHSRTIVNRNSFSSTRNNFNHGSESRGGSFGGHESFRGTATQHMPEGTHSGAFSGFDHGGVARSNSFRGQSSFGGFHGGGGGFHGGGGGFHGGGGGHR
jgi:hypothetical protein